MSATAAPASEPRGPLTARRHEVYDPTLDDELQLVARLAAAAAQHREHLSDAEIDEVLLT